jgi:uncharacterized protein
VVLECFTKQALRRLDFSSAAEARATLTRGLPWIDKHFSVAHAQWLWRILLIGLPLALLCGALCTLARSLMYWHLESSVNRWYGELKYIENDLETTKLSRLDSARHGIQLRAIATAMNNFDAPPELMKRLFMLKKHIDFVRHKLLALSRR